MRTLSLLTALLIFLVNCVLAQQDTQPDWKFMPGFVWISYFPGEPIPSGWYESRYSGMGLNFQVRGFHRDFPALAFTLSGGVNWFDSGLKGGYPSPGDGVGGILKGHSFRTFPVAVGLEGVLPRSKDHALMFFAGGNVGLHFVDGYLDMGQQMKLGYAVGVGFAVKVFEFGVRYYSFSDIRSIGAHLGLRFPQFSIN